jgi:hypothetical protein
VRIVGDEDFVCILTWAHFVLFVDVGANLVQLAQRACGYSARLTTLSLALPLFLDSASHDKRDGGTPQSDPAPAPSVTLSAADLRPPAGAFKAAAAPGVASKVKLSAGSATSSVATKKPPATATLRPPASAVSAAPRPVATKAVAVKALSGASVATPLARSTVGSSASDSSDEDDDDGDSVDLQQRVVDMLALKDTPARLSAEVQVGLLLPWLVRRTFLYGPPYDIFPCFALISLHDRLASSL